MYRAPPSSAGGSVGTRAWGPALAQVHTVSPGTVRPQDRPLQENEGGTGKRKFLNRGLMTGLTFWLKQKHRVNVFLKKSGCGRLYRMRWFPEFMFSIKIINCDFHV